MPRGVAPGFVASVVGLLTPHGALESDHHFAVSGLGCGMATITPTPSLLGFRVAGQGMLEFIKFRRQGKLEFIRVAPSVFVFCCTNIVAGRGTENIVIFV